MFIASARAGFDAPLLSSLSTTQLYVLFGVTFGVTVLICFYGWYASNRVRDTSRMLQELTRLNEGYHFHTGIRKTERLTKPCNSKAQFDKVILENFFKAVIDGNIDHYDDLLAKIEANRLLYKEYAADCSAIRSSADRASVKRSLIPLFLYRHIERNRFRSGRLNPAMDISFIVRTTYVSPKGKNSYQRSYAYSLAETKRVLDDVHRMIEHRQTKEYQRAIMSDGLRYEIMHRDGFRCQLCGRSAKDGAILHVDHILPVSRGGKTEKANLRTLCDQCNLGKRDRIE